MKKNSTVKQSPTRASAAGKEGPITIGLDLGDKASRYCVLGTHVEPRSEGSVDSPDQEVGQQPCADRPDLVSAERHYARTLRRLPLVGDPRWWADDQRFSLTRSGPLMEAATIGSGLLFFRILPR